MTITDTRTTQSICFNEISRGDAFQYGSDFYLKVDQKSAFCFNTKNLCYMSLHDIIIPLDAELVIK